MASRTSSKAAETVPAAPENPIRAYWDAICSGEVVVSKKVKRVYRKVVDDLDHPGRWVYSDARADHVISFAERYCRHSKGKFGGKPVRLELWEKAFLAALFGFIDDDGNRKYQRGILIVAKKNGKSLLASIVGNYMLFADGEAGPEVYAVATKRDQAKIIWEEARRMIKKSPALSKRARTLVAEIRNDANDGVFKPLASDSNRLDGLNVHCVLMDEFHQWKAGRELYDIMADGITARSQPLILMTSTAGTIRQDIYDEIYEECERILDGYEAEDGYKDERTLPIIYELDSRNEWTDPDAWQKANPGLGTIKNRVTLEEKVERTKKNLRLLKNLLCKEFNIRETNSAAWLTYEEIRNRETFRIDRTDGTVFGDPQAAVLHPRYGIGGVDLSSTTDLTAAKVIFMVPGDERLYVLSMYWLPEELLEARAHEDQIPYDLWRDQGLLRTCRGNKINPHDVTEWFIEVQEEYDIYLYAVGYDAWSAEMWAAEMKAQFGEDTMIPVRQGVKTLSNPMKLLGTDLCAKRIVYNDNPIDEWCLMNTSYEEDKNGNIQPKKTNNPRRRIDGTAALLDAYVVFCDRENEYRQVI